MDIKNVFIIYNPVEFTKNQIIVDLKEEGYSHNFCFSKIEFDRKYLESNLKIADEVWCFGFCEKLLDYSVAKRKGLDIWQMG